MSRARTNWQRLQNVRTHVARYQAGFESLQRWEHPVVSMAAIVGTTLLSFFFFILRGRPSYIQCVLSAASVELH